MSGFGARHQIDGIECRNRNSSFLSGSALLTTLSVVLLETGDELSDTKILDHGLQDSVVVDVDFVDLDLGFLGDEIHLSLSFLLLESEGDSSDGSLLDSLHQVGGETGNLVSESLGLDLRDVINDSLVDVEVLSEPIVNALFISNVRQKMKSEVAVIKPSAPTWNIDLLSVVFLNHSPGGSLDGLGSDSSLYTSSN